MNTQTHSASEIELAREMHSAGLLSQEELDAMLGGSTPSTLTAEIVEEAANIDLGAERVIPDEELERATTEIEAAEAREEAYASQDGGTTLLSEEEVQSAESVQGDGSPAKPARRARGANTAVKADASVSKGKGKRVSRVTTNGSLAATAAVIAGDPAVEAIVAGLAKKVQEKAVNALDWKHNGKTLSVFTRHAINELTATGTLTSKRLVEILSSPSAKGGAGYTIGTARSQAQQVMTVLPVLGLAVREANGALSRVAAP